MKHLLHKNRKSFAKWAMTGQRSSTNDAQRLLALRKKYKTNPFKVKIGQ